MKFKNRLCVLKEKMFGMCYIDNNLQCLRKNKMKLYNIIIEVIEKKEYDFNKFKVVSAKNGQKIVEIETKDGNVRLNSLYNPEKEAKTWVKKCNFNNLDISVQMFGIVNGIFVREMLENLKKDSLVFLVEPDISLFIFCLYNFDMTDIISDERVAFFIKDVNFNEYYMSLLTKVSVRMLNTQIVCFHPNMEKIYQAESAEFCDVIMRRIRKVNIDYNTVLDLGDVALDNTIANLHFIKNSNYVGNLVGKIPDDIPFIIVAAGPSLDKNIKELKRAEGKAFIIACDRAVKSLLENDIEFSAVITIDSSKESELLSNPKCFDYYMFACFDSKNEILEMNHLNKIWLNSSSFFYSICKNHDVSTKYYTIGGSVATAAFNVARILGMKRIIFVGQDLAFDGEVTHAGGENDNADVNKLTQFVDGVCGNKVKTRADWVKYLEWYKTSIKELPEGIDVIDATEGGAKIEGANIMKLSDVIDRYCEKKFDFKEIMKNIPAMFNKEEYTQIRNELLHMEIEIDDIKKYADRGKKEALKLYEISKKGMIDEKKEYEYSMTIKDMNDLIEQQLVYTIISEYIRKDVEPVMRGVNCISDDKKKNLEETCLIAKFIYEKIFNATDVIKPKLHKALKKI